MITMNHNGIQMGGNGGLNNTTQFAYTNNGQTSNFNFNCNFGPSQEYEDVSDDEEANYVDTLQNDYWDN